MKDNKLIAEFMGIEYGDYITPHYHCNWNELIRVVDKIKRTDLSREMVMQGIDELITEIDDSFDFNIAITYDAVVKFIEEYNKVKRNELQSL